MNPEEIPEDIILKGNINSQFREYFTKEALNFTAELSRSFRHLRGELISKRLDSENDAASGVISTFFENTKAIRTSQWEVNPSPLAFSDFFDNNKPVIYKLDFFEKEEQSVINNNYPHYLFQPRSLSEDEDNFIVDDQVISASIFDFSLYFNNNPDKTYLYLDDIKNHYEARLWHDMFVSSTDTFNIPESSIKVCIGINDIQTIFQLEEIIYELQSNAFGIYLDSEFFQANDDFFIELENGQPVNLKEYIDYVAKKRKVDFL